MLHSPSRSPLLTILDFLFNYIWPQPLVILINTLIPYGPKSRTPMLFFVQNFHLFYECLDNTYFIYLE